MAGGRKAVHWYPGGPGRSGRGPRLLALAMHFDSLQTQSESDSLRLAAVLEHTAFRQVCAVGEAQREMSGNMSLNFRAKVAALIERVIDEQPDVLVLDYFWLENNYYTNRYGRNWQEKTQMLFTYLSDLQYIILPCDRLSGELAEDFSISNQQNFPHPGNKELHVHLLTSEQARQCHPLVVATCLARTKLLKLKKSHDTHSRVHEAQEAQYLARDFPFLCISRTSSIHKVLGDLMAYCKRAPPPSVPPKIVIRKGNRDFMLAEGNGRKDQHAQRRAATGNAKRQRIQR